MNRVEVLQNGYSKSSEPSADESEINNSVIKLPSVRANCSSVLITGTPGANVIVDTMTPWDSDFILQSLRARGLEPDDINYVVGTHGHSDHIGNNNLFLKAHHIVGFCLSFRDRYYLHPFDQGKVLQFEHIYFSLIMFIADKFFGSI